MFNYWRERRRLKREIAELIQRGEAEQAELEGRPSALAGPLILFQMLEYERLMKKARRLGIEYKRPTDHDDGYELTENGQLVGEGYARLRKMIRDERLNVAEKWVKILVPLITAIASVLGLIIALITISRK
jgi:hypothetical protein